MLMMELALKGACVVVTMMAWFPVATAILNQMAVVVLNLAMAAMEALFGSLDAAMDVHLSRAMKIFVTAMITKSEKN